MGDKMDLVGEIRWWAQLPTVKKFEKFPTAFADTGDRVSANDLLDIGRVLPCYNLFTQGLTRVVSLDTDTRVRPLENSLPDHFLTRAVSDP